MIELLPIPLRQLPFFNKVAIIPINFIALSLLMLVFLHDHFRQKTSKIFGAMAFLMLVWVDFAYCARLFARDIALGEILLRIAWVATPPLFYFTYLISLHLMNVGRKYKKISIILAVLTTILSLLTAFSDYIIAGITFSDVQIFGVSTLIIVYGKLFWPFLVVIFALMISTIVPIFKGTMNKGTKVFLVGIIIFYLANLIFNIALPAIWNVSYLYYFGDYSTIVLLGFTSYAIMRHELFDVRVVASEFLTIIIWSILFSKLFVSQSFSEFAVDLTVFLFVIIFGLLLIRSSIKEARQRELLQELTDKLKAIDKQKDTFISMAAHELRAPMTAIKGYVSMVMEGDTGDIPEKARGFLADASNITDRLVRLVNNMLNVSRIEEGRMVYQEEVENLSQVARAVFGQFAPEAQRKGLEYKLEIPNEMKDRVQVDPDRIQEVIGNFLSNAIKYTDKGSVIVKLSQPSSNVVRCEVVDTGPGISKEEQQKLFQKFHRVESNVGKTTGTGLGLYISRLLVEKFNGKIGVESESGKGSIFWFELPLSE